MEQITIGMPVAVVDAIGRVTVRRALSDVVMGEDFQVVWTCTESEWEAARQESREPSGTPWPAEDVRPA